MFWFIISTLHQGVVAVEETSGGVGKLFWKYLPFVHAINVYKHIN